MNFNLALKYYEPCSDPGDVYITCLDCNFDNLLDLHKIFTIVSGNGREYLFCIQNSSFHLCAVYRVKNLSLSSSLLSLIMTSCG